MCWDCYNNKGGDPYKDFRHGKVEVEDFEDEIPYRKAGGKRSKNKKVCKKSKAKEPCDMSATTTVGSYGRRDRDGNWTYQPRLMRCCSRCGRYDWGSYFSRVYGW